MPKFLKFPCPKCKTEIKISRDENGELKHEVMDPEKPKPPIEKKKSILDAIFGDDDDDSDS